MLYQLPPEPPGMDIVAHRSVCDRSLGLGRLSQSASVAGSWRDSAPEAAGGWWDADWLRSDHRSTCDSLTTRESDLRDSGHIFAMADAPRTDAAARGDTLQPRTLRDQEATWLRSDGDVTLISLQSDLTSSEPTARGVNSQATESSYGQPTESSYWQPTESAVIYIQSMQRGRMVRKRTTFTSGVSGASLQTESISLGASLQTTITMESSRLFDTGPVTTPSGLSGLSTQSGQPELTGSLSAKFRSIAQREIQLRQRQAAMKEVAKERCSHRVVRLDSEESMENEDSPLASSMSSRLQAATTEKVLRKRRPSGDESHETVRTVSSWTSAVGKLDNLLPGPFEPQKDLEPMRSCLKARPSDPGAFEMIWSYFGMATTTSQESQEQPADKKVKHVSFELFV